MENNIGKTYPPAFGAQYRERVRRGGGGVSGQECCMCGRQTEDRATYLVALNHESAHRYPLPDDKEDAISLYPVGPTCKDRVPPEHLYILQADGQYQKAIRPLVWVESESDEHVEPLGAHEVLAETFRAAEKAARFYTSTAEAAEHEVRAWVVITACTATSFALEIRPLPTASRNETRANYYRAMFAVASAFQDADAVTGATHTSVFVGCIPGETARGVGRRLLDALRAGGFERVVSAPTERG